jgi:hypothetical protein
VLASGKALCARCETPRLLEIPWERRKELGILRAAARTVRAVLLRPGEFFGIRPRERSILPALVLAMAFSIIEASAEAAVAIAFAEERRAVLLKLPFGRDFLWVVRPEVQIAWVIVAPFAFVVWVYVWAALWWIGLRAVHGLNGTYSAIVRTLCYAKAVSILAPVTLPLAEVGPFGSGIALAYTGLALAIEVMAMARSQRISPGRALIACSLATFLVALLGCAVLAVAFERVAADILGRPLVTTAAYREAAAGESTNVRSAGGDPEAQSSASPSSTAIAWGSPPGDGHPDSVSMAGPMSFVRARDTTSPFRSPENSFMITHRRRFECFVSHRPCLPYRS